MLDVLWPDAELDSVFIDYDSARVTLRETTGSVVSVEGHGVIGTDLIGLWDEIVVSSGELVGGHPFAAQCWNAVQQRLGDGLSDSGSPDRNSRAFTTLVITLSDGCELRVVASRFTAARQPAR
jgi:hypothetical protein